MKVTSIPRNSRWYAEIPRTLFLVLTIFLILPRICSANPECADYSNLMREPVPLSIGGEFITRSEGTAFVVNGSTLHRMSLAIPDAPRETGTYTLPTNQSYLHGIVQVGEDLVVATRLSDIGVYVFHVGENSSLVPQSFFPSIGISDIATLGSRTFVAVAQDTMRIFELPVDDSAYVRATFVLPRRGSLMDVEDGQILLSPAGGGMMLVDATDPDAPQLVTNTVSWPKMLSATLLGDWFYFVDENGLHTVSIADPGHPQERQFIPLPDVYSRWEFHASRLAVENGTLFAVCYPGRLHAFDLSNPEEIRAIGALNILVGINSMVLDESHHFAYLLGSDALWSLDLSRPENLKYDKVYAEGEGVGAACWIDEGTRALVTLGYDGIKVIEKNSAGEWAEIASMETYPKRADNAVCDGRYAYVAVSNYYHDYYYGDLNYPVVYVLDLGDPPDIRLLRSISTGSTASTGVTFHQDGHQVSVSFRYQSGDNSYTQTLWDRSVGEEPHVIRACCWYGTYPVNGAWYSLDANSIKILEPVPDHAAGMQVAREVPLAHDGATGMVRSGDYLYVMGGGIQVFDVSNPQAPSLLNTVSARLTECVDLTVSGNLLAGAHGAQGLVLFDLQDPLYPQLKGVAPPDYTAASVSVASGGILVADPTGGALLYPPPCEVAVPVLAALTQLSVDSIDGGVRVRWDALPSLSWESFGILRSRNGGPTETLATIYDPVVGEQQIDLTLPLSERSGIYSVLGRAGGEEYLSEEVTFQIPATSALVLQGAVPNPFNPSTEIVYYQSNSSPAHLRIFDTRGRKVWSHGEAGSVGWHRVPWHGVDDEGRAVASGSYKVLLEVEGRQRTGGLTLLR